MRSAVRKRTATPRGLLLAAVVLAGGCGSADADDIGSTTSTGPAATGSSPASDGGSSSTGAPPTSARTDASTTAPSPAEVRLDDRARHICDSAVLAGTTPWSTETLPEASGLAASRRHEGVLWSHNDSGWPVGVHAFGPDGSPRGFFELADSPPDADPEDLAIGPGSSGNDDDHLYLADVGDNAYSRESITVFRFPEPEPRPDDTRATLTDVERLDFTYPDGPRDAESLLIDAAHRELVIITKRIENVDGRAELRAAEVYTASIDEPAAELERIGTIDVQALADRSTTTTLLSVLRGEAGAPTAADIAVDGVIALRTYATVWIFGGATSDRAAERLLGEPCEAAAPLETQGEAIAWSPRGDAYLTVSESTRPQLVRVEVP